VVRCDIVASLFTVRGGVLYNIYDGVGALFMCY